jgi:O-phosphoseryl-tRNA(Cys) synthetase
MNLEKLLFTPLQGLKPEEIKFIEKELEIIINPDPNWYNITINGITSDVIASHESIMDCMMNMGEGLVKVISIIKKVNKIRENNNGNF